VGETVRASMQAVVVAADTIDLAARMSKLSIHT
jgi:hypothetical protein